MTNPALNVSKTGVQELSQRLLFLLGAMLVFRIGTHIPVPGLDPVRLAALFNQQNGMLGLFNMFSGGALQRLTIFALGIMPYISASIIVQLFTIVVPKFEELKKEGESGQRKLNQYTRYGTIFIASLHALGMCKFLTVSGIALQPDFNFYFTAMVTLVTGAIFLMWLGEQVTERGIGNGISMVIFAGIVAGLPGAISRTLEYVHKDQIKPITLLIIIALVVAVTAVVILFECAQRRITIQYAQRQQGRKMYAAQSTHLPLKINMSGVIPPIFASSIILFPATLADWFGKVKGFEWLHSISLALSQGQPLHIILFTATIVFFCFFYTALAFNPKETAENLKRSGGYIPGIRPGEQTARYIDSVMTRLTLVGAIYISVVCLLPEFMNLFWHVPFYFGGTSLLIIVVVGMDFIAQVRALLMSHQYEALMKKANLKTGGGSSRFSR